MLTTVWYKYGNTYEGRYESNATCFPFKLLLHRLSCLTHQIATLSSSARRIGAPHSHASSTQ